MIEREVVEAREGMATVYDDKGRYLGCLGIEFWQWLLDSGRGSDREAVGGKRGRWLT